MWYFVSMVQWLYDCRIGSVVGMRCTPSRGPSRALSFAAIGLCHRVCFAGALWSRGGVDIGPRDRYNSWTWWCGRAIPSRAAAPCSGSLDALSFAATSVCHRVCFAGALWSRGCVDIGPRDRYNWLMWCQMLAVCVSSVSRSLTLFSVSLCII